MSALLARRGMRTAISGLTLELSSRVERQLALHLFVSARAAASPPAAARSSAPRTHRPGLARQATPFEPEPLTGRAPSGIFISTGPPKVGTSTAAP